MRGWSIRMPCSDLPLWAQYLSSLSGLSGVIALITIWYNYWRGPDIKCSAFRSIQLVNSGNGTMIGTSLVFTNTGYRSGVIDRIAISLEPWHSGGDQRLLYLPLIEGFVAEREGFPSPQDRPVNPFSVESKSTISKWIYFANQENRRFIRGNYILKLYCRLGDDRTFKLLSERSIQLGRDLTDAEWMWAVDPLGNDTVFSIPQEEIRIEWWRIFI